MGTDLVPATWEPLTQTEVDEIGGALRLGAGRLCWHSPRPFSAAAVVDGDPGFFVKRHHREVRSVAQLRVEHRLAAHLGDHGVAVPRPLGIVAMGESVYEAHERALGLDVYRDAVSWSPFAHTGHARAAGVALARLHLAAMTFEAPARRPGPLLGGWEVLGAPDPLAAIAGQAEIRPGLGTWLRGTAWREALEPVLPAATAPVAELAGDLPAGWTHNDWHASNLTWSDAGPDADVAEVIDLGLANRSPFVLDLAVAIERNAVSWLDLDAGAGAAVHADHVEALVAGYEAVRPLGRAERSGLAALLPVAHVDYALSEVEYFHSVLADDDGAAVAFHRYLVGHLRWWAGPAGRALQDQVLSGR